MDISEDVLKSFKRGRVFKNDGNPRINSIAFHRTADLLVTASDDDAIRIYDTYSGTDKRLLYSKKYGVANISFAHDVHSVIYSSNKGPDHAWRYHDLQTNKYVRYFRGHQGRVTTLCLSPKNDVVLSAAEDKQVRLWDLRTGLCQAMLHAPGLPTVAFDEQGLVFSVGAESGVVKLFDARNFASGPFAAFVVEDERNQAAVFASLKFSLDGKYLLAVVEGRIYVMDAFDGTVLRKVSSGVTEGGTALEACLTADGQYILSGGEDCSIHVWNVNSGDQVACWKGHAERPTCLKWSPKKMLVASACSALALWIPDMNQLGTGEAAPLTNA